MIGTVALVGFAALATLRWRHSARVLRQILVSIDQLGQVLIVGAIYIAGLADICPSADETISSYVGRGARRGAWWARLSAPLIDGLFRLLGEDWGHCERNVEAAFAGAAPQA